MVPECCHLRPYLGIETVSSVEKDGKDGHGLKLEKTGQLFQFLMLNTLLKSPKTLWLVFPDEICLISAAYINSKGAFSVWLRALSNDLSTELNQSSNVIVT